MKNTFVQTKDILCKNKLIHQNSYLKYKTKLTLETNFILKFIILDITVINPIRSDN